MKKHLKNVGVVLCALSVTIVLTPRARAWHGHGPWVPPCSDYEESVSTQIAQAVVAIEGDCAEVPLTLDGNAWSGGYQRQVSLETTYRIDHYDYCSGASLGSEQQTDTSLQTLEFNVVNPNLAPDLPSYVANAPMTPQEAQAALPEALGRCQALHTGEWPQ